MTVEHHVAALAIASTAVVMVAADVAESVGGWVADGSKVGVIGAGMAIAYKITAKANADAVILYKEAAADADARLDKERKDWERERAQLYDELARMRGHQP